MAYIRIDISSGEVEESYGEDKKEDKDKKQEGIDRRYEIEPDLQIVPVTEKAETEDEDLPPPCWDPDWLSKGTRDSIRKTL
jgi:hypothetical protein